VPDTAARLNVVIGGGGVVRGGEAGSVTGESNLSALLQPRLADPSLRPEGEVNPWLKNKSCPLAPFSDEDDWGRPLPVWNCGAIGDIERRFNGTMRLVNVSDSHSDWLPGRRVFNATADAGGVIDDSESPFRCGEGVDLVSKVVELSRSGLGADLGEGLEGVGDINSAREAIESLMTFVCTEGASSPDSGGVGVGRTLLLGCGSMLSRGGRK
jgi:hypothetical protein